MNQYVVRTCLKCNHSFKSKSSTVHVRCSRCGSVKVVAALEMPKQNSQDIEIDKLKDVIAELEHRIETMDGNVRGAFSKFNERVNSNTTHVNNIGKRLKQLGG